MNFNEYQPLALVTESKIKQVDANKSGLLALLALCIATTEIMDIVKKNVFYGREIDKVFLDKRIAEIQSMANALSEANLKYADKERIKVSTRLFHGIIGKYTESGELLSALEEHISTGEAIDLANLREEIGDDQWYNAIIIDVSDSDMGSILDTNIAKLKARYGDKFTNEKAINRDLVTERKILEGDKV